MGDSRALWRVALLCRCPACGRGALYAGLLTVRESCPVCGLDLRNHDAGDGAVAIVTLLLGGILVAGAFWVEFRFAPPIWVHVLLWPALGFPLAVVMIRISKAALVAQQYRVRRAQMGPDAQ